MHVFQNGVLRMVGAAYSLQSGIHIRYSADSRAKTEENLEKYSCNAWQHSTELMPSRPGSLGRDGPRVKYVLKPCFYISEV